MEERLLGAAEHSMILRLVRTYCWGSMEMEDLAQAYRLEMGLLRQSLSKMTVDPSVKAASRMNCRLC